MKRHGWFLQTIWGVVCSVSLFAATVSFGAEAGDGEVKFRWAFGLLEAAGAGGVVTRVGGDTEMKSGDRIKMYIEPATDGFIYLFYLSSQGDLERLFPAGSDPLRAGSPGVYIPQGDLWFRLDDHPGTETFYLLASSRRLKAVESAFERYLDGQDSASRQELQANVIEEIRRVRKARRKLTAAAERPIPVGASLRGVTQDKASPHGDLAAMAVEISAEDFYSRTFTIDHR